MPLKAPWEQLFYLSKHNLIFSSVYFYDSEIQQQFHNIDEHDKIIQSVIRIFIVLAPAQCLVHTVSVDGKDQ